jgi:hypothetical protein
MFFNANTRPVIRHLSNLKFPEGTDLIVRKVEKWENLSGQKVLVRIEATTQELVRAVRKLFPGVIWSKSHNQFWGWCYSGIVRARRFRNPSFAVEINGCKEAPPTCHAIVEQVEVEESVQVVAPQYETRKVMREKVRYECTDGAKVEGASA